MLLSLRQTRFDFLVLLALRTKLCVELIRPQADDLVGWAVFVTAQ